MQEKMRVAEYIPHDASRILDVGCADGTVTKALAGLFPRASVRGIDLDEEFIAKAKEGVAAGKGTPEFERIYLRQMLDRPERYDAVTFVSVLHEFYSYGEGMSSVLKAVADAYELLKPGEKIIIRDMILQDAAKTASADSIIEKVRANVAMAPLITDFERAHGPMTTLYSVNHFLLKYFYTDNWERECPEHYVPVTREQYEQLFNLLGADLEHKETYLIPFLRDKWKADFGLTDEELRQLFSTTILVARKPVEKNK